MSKHRLFLSLAASLAIASVAIAAPQTAAPVATKAKVKVKLDANGDGVIDRNEAAKHPRLAQRFDQLDANKDGRLSAEERPVRAMKRGMRGHRGAGMKMQLDADKDDRISRAEAAKEPRFAERFAKMDVNNDDFIDRTDHAARAATRRAKWFTVMDANRDGQVSRAEYDASHAKRMAEREAKQAQRKGAAKP